jgi:hypothetical protein
LGDGARAASGRAAKHSDELAALHSDHRVGEYEQPVRESDWS